MEQLRFVGTAVVGYKREEAAEGGTGVGGGRVMFPFRVGARKPVSPMAVFLFCSEGGAG